MKKSILSIVFLSFFAINCLAAQKKTFSVESVEPPYWWASMRNPSLQLLVHGNDVGIAEVAVDYPGVSVDSVVRSDNPDYLFIYLNIGKDAQPGTVPLQFTCQKKKKTVDYRLLQRTRQPEEYVGFDSSDVLYLIMPDRFAKGSDSAEKGTARLRNKAEIDRTNNHRRHGGDIAGIKNHLDYIDSLGVTAIWVNPVLENDMPGGSYHGYSTTDYYNIDPRFGGNDEWREFVAAAHDKGLKVVMDMIFNHCGSGHPWMESLPMKDWINFPDEYVQTNHRLSTLYDPYVSDYDKKKATDGWFVRSMPDLNQHNPHMMTYLIQNSIWWIEDSKIDGIRMDTHPYADMEGMARWIKAVENEYPNFNIVGECWYANEGSSAFWQRNSAVNKVTNPELPTVMDFALCLNARDAFSQPTDATRKGLNFLYDHLAMDFLFPDPTKILTFLDNHDTDRFLTELPENLDRWKQAQAFLLTTRGIPQIYYGTEILMNGTRANGGDGAIRLDMPGGFPGDSITVFDGSGMTDLQRDAFGFLSKLLHFRRDSNALQKGSLKHFVPESGLYVYERKYGDDRVIVLMNGNDTPITVDMTQMAEALPNGSKYTDILTDAEFTVSPTMEFAPRALLILKQIDS